MSKFITFVGVLLLLLSMLMNGCLEGNRNTAIEIEIDSYYPFNVDGYYTIDGVRFQNFSLGLLGNRSFLVNISSFPEKQHYNVTMYIESHEGTINASCDKVKKYVKFVIGMSYVLACSNYQ